MKAIIIQFPFGILALNEENSILEKALFPKKPQAAAKALLRIESGKTPEAFTKMITQLQETGYDYFVFDNAVLANEAQKKLNAKTELLPKPSEASQLMENLEPQYHNGNSQTPSQRCSRTERFSRCPSNSNP
jgi:hypothetical protein